MESCLEFTKTLLQEIWKIYFTEQASKALCQTNQKNLLHSQTVQEILGRLDNSYKRFFKKLCKRPPKFKKAEKFNSFVFKQGGFALNGNVFTINKINKRFKFSYSRPYDGNVNRSEF